MLLWAVIACGFVACVVICHLWHGITRAEAIALFIAFSLVFAHQLNVIFEKATTDYYLISGYVTSLVYHPPYSYRDGKHTEHVPEAFIIEQRSRPPIRKLKIKYSIHNGNGIEYCYGECFFAYPEPPYGAYEPAAPKDRIWNDTFELPVPINYSSKVINDKAYAYSIWVDAAKFDRTELGESSTVWIPYINPIPVTEEVVYNHDQAMPYFKISNYNQADRLIAPQVFDQNRKDLEKINAALANHRISLGLIITPDQIYFEKLKRAWHQGKGNDFIIVIYSPDNKHIRNVNVLGWNNYELKVHIVAAIMSLPSTNIDEILSVIKKTMQEGPRFKPTDLSRYSFLNVHIPTYLYWKMFIYQFSFFIYMILLLNFNPNTKNKKMSLSEIFSMWDKRFRPPSWNWYLHPFVPTGLFLYFILPSLVFFRLF